MVDQTTGSKPECTTPGCSGESFRNGLCGKCFMWDLRHGHPKRQKAIEKANEKAAARAKPVPIFPDPKPLAAPPDPPKPARQEFKSLGRGSHVKIMDKMEGVLSALFSSLENLGGPAYIQEALASDSKSGRATLLKEILALGKKYMDFKAQEADAKRAKEAQSGPANYFVIKNLQVGPDNPDLPKNSDIGDGAIFEAAFRTLGKVKDEEGYKS